MPQSRQQSHTDVHPPATDPWVGEDEAWLEHFSEDEWADELESTRGFFRSIMTVAVIGTAVWALLAFAVYRLVVG
jgi:hypothetical protein